MTTQAKISQRKFCREDMNETKKLSVKDPRQAWAQEDEKCMLLYT